MVPAFILDLIKPITDIVDKLIPDKDKKREFQLELEKLADAADLRFHETMLGQIETNKKEAEHASVFVAGWRPFIGWTGGVSLAYTFVVSPIASQVSRWLGYTGEMVVLDTNSLMALVLAMLGVGGLRSFDKLNGTAALPKSSTKNG